MEILSVPHFDEFLLVSFCPFPDELPAAFGETAFNDVEIFQLHNSQMLSVLDVDVPRGMFSVDEEHPDDNSVEATYFRHIGLRLSSFSSPNVNRSPRQTAATREAPAAVWRRAGGLVGRYHIQPVQEARPAIAVLKMV